MSIAGLPSLGLLVKLGSIIVHADEMTSQDGHRFDRVAFESLLSDPEVVEWISGMTKAGFLPVKRKGGGVSC